MKFGWLSAASWHELSRKWEFSHVKNKLLTQTVVTKGLEWRRGRKSSGSTLQGEREQSALGFCDFSFVSLYVLGLLI